MSMLEIRNLTKRFGDHEALKGISLDIEQGTIVSLLGVNGAGKTTLSSIIATLHPPTSGDILFNGTSIYDNIPQFRRQIGYCPQKPNLNSLFSARENLIFAGRYFGMDEKSIHERIDLIAHQFGLHGYLDKNPAILSGGYKQRFSIARSLMHNPKFIILDEPTVALDPHVRHQLWDYIKNLKQLGISILLTTHYLDEAEVLSDHVCILDQGRIRLIDTPQNLMASFEKKNLEDVFIHLMHNE